MVLFPGDVSTGEPHLVNYNVLKVLILISYTFINEWCVSCYQQIDLAVIWYLQQRL